MSNKINIAIDGYAGCGKSTLAKDLARELNYLFIDTGAMYRALTLYFIDNEIALNDMPQIEYRLSNTIQLHFASESNHIFLNGEDVEEQIRERRDIAANVSELAAIPSIRTWLKDLQQSMITEGGVVMEGRDIGTVIMPDADVKIFMTADTNVRAKRRRMQFQEKGIDLSSEEVLEQLTQRDKQDIERATAPLKVADDAIVFDNSHLNQEEQIKALIAICTPKIDPESLLPFMK